MTVEVPHDKDILKHTEYLFTKCLCAFGDDLQLRLVSIYGYIHPRACSITCPTIQILWAFSGYIY